MSIRAMQMVWEPLASLELGDSGICLVCGRDFVVEKDVHRLGLCDGCASIIANLYQHAHSGEWLTWKNDRPEKPGYVKAKIPSALRWEVWKRDRFTCQACGAQEDLTVDHVIAEVLGGPTSIENLQTLCRSCNGKKGARP